MKIRTKQASYEQVMEAPRFEHRAPMKPSRFLHGLIKLLTTTPGTTDAINQFLEELALHHHADRAYIIEYDLSQQTLTNTFEWCAPGVESEIELLQQLDLSIVDEWNQRFADVGDFYISSVNQQLDKDSMDYKLLEMQGVESLMAAPFVKNGVIIGFLGVDNPKVAYRQSNLLRATADVLMVELDKRRMLEQTERLMNEDALTGLKNRHSYISALKQIEMNLPETLGFVYVDINGLSKLNEIYGEELGDDVIIRTAHILRKHAGEHREDHLGRHGDAGHIANLGVGHTDGRHEQRHIWQVQVVRNAPKRLRPHACPGISLQ